jgi:hypothetical protein
VDLQGKNGEGRSGFGIHMDTERDYNQTECGRNALAEGIARVSQIGLERTTGCAGAWAKGSMLEV